MWFLSVPPPPRPIPNHKFQTKDLSVLTKYGAGFVTIATYSHWAKRVTHFLVECGTGRIEIQLYGFILLTCALSDVGCECVLTENNGGAVIIHGSKWVLLWAQLLPNSSFIPLIPSLSLLLSFCLSPFLSVYLPFPLLLPLLLLLFLLSFLFIFPSLSSPPFSLLPPPSPFIISPLPQHYFSHLLQGSYSQWSSSNHPPSPPLLPHLPHHI